MLINRTLDANKESWGGPTTHMLEGIKTLTLNKVKENSSNILKFDKAKNGTGVKKINICC